MLQSKAELFEQYCQGQLTPIGTFSASAFDGIVILHIDTFHVFGYYKYSFELSSGKVTDRKFFKLKLNYTQKRVFFRLHNQRYYLDEFLRI